MSLAYITCHRKKSAREKRETSQYKEATARTANQQFEFIDLQWIPSNSAGIMCPEEYREDLLMMVKRHTLLHPLIPVSKDIFWSREQIYCESVYCYVLEFDLDNFSSCTAAPQFVCTP
jgi:hypothetical protein